ncbi:MAG: ABC transporter ATP-binding protein [Rhodoferax sp.]|nr:ABC transporter ATP-binding protein [Rhodoferax sp.]
MSELDLLQVQQLAVDFADAGQTVVAVRDVGFSLAPGGRLALLGETGSGKSVSMMAVAGLLPDNARVRGSIRWPSLAGPPQLGRDVGMVFQDPMSSLNPVLSIGEQIAEVGMTHLGHDRSQALHHVRSLLERVGIEATDSRLAAYPHQLSGGQRQRVAIAMAIAAGPKLLIADEPTTALDTIVQAQIMALIDTLVRDAGMALLLVTHDIALARSIARHGVVLRHGTVVEQASMDDIVARPTNPYTQSLIAASLDVDRPVPARAAAPGGPVPLLAARGLHKTLGQGSAALQVLRGVGIDLAVGETLALVGGSGAGKTTLARIVMRLTEADAGAVSLDGVDLLALRGEPLRLARQRFQMVFQDPLGALNPRASIGRLLADPLRLHGFDHGAAAVEVLLRRVGLDPALAQRRPHEVSGGQRQRVNIARALATRPALLVLDEPVSSLDVSVRAQILELLRSIQQETGIGCLFISHDLAVVRTIADRVAVMADGQIVETGPTAEVIANPQHAMTQALLRAAPRLGRRTTLEGVPL